MFRKLLALALATTPLAAQAEWYKVETNRFAMMGDFKSEAEAKARGEKLEKFVFVLRALSAQPNVDSPQKINIFYTPTTTDMLNTFPGTFPESSYGVGAYYLAGARQSIVVSPIRGYSAGQLIQTNRSAVAAPDTFAQDAFWHELSHAFMFQSVSYAYPPWYSEGYAEYYGTIKISDDNKITIGAPQHGRIETLRSNWYPSSKFLTKRSYADAGENIYSIYAEGWLLIHYCANNKERGAQMKKYLADINANVPYSEAAKAFGDLDQLDRELQQYVSKSIPMLSIGFKPIDVGPIAARKATPAEVALYKYDVKLNQGVFRRDFGSFVGEIRAIAARTPNDPYALRILTEAENKAGDLDAAQAANARWLAVAPNDPWATLYRGRIAAAKLGAARTPAKDPAWAAAREDILTAARANPGDPLPKQAIYQSYLLAGELPPPSAQTALFEAVKTVPHDDDLRFLLASDYERRGMIAEAITTIKVDAVRIKPAGELSPAERARKSREKSRRQEFALQGEDVDREDAREFYERLVAKQGGAEAKAVAADKAAEKRDGGT